MSTEASPQLSPPSAPSPIRWRWRLGALLLGIIAIWFCRAPLLRLVPALLITGTISAPIDVVVIMDGAGSYEEAARRLRENPSVEIWLFDRQPNRLQQRGIIPPSRDCALANCEAVGITKDRIRFPSQQVAGIRSLLDEIDRLAAEHPEQRIGLLTDEWNSRRIAGQMQHRIAGPARSRVVLLPVSDPSVPRDSWWQTKPARRRVAESAMAIVADWLIVDRDASPVLMSDDELRSAGIPQ
jgi:hypothetical protein